MLNLIQTLLLCLMAVLHAVGASGAGLFPVIMGSMLLLPVVYFAFLTSGGRQTFGYRLAGVQVVTAGQQPIGWWRSLWRTILNLVFYVFTACIIGWANYIMIGVTRSKRALHDLWSGTQVVRVTAPRHVALEACAFAGVVLPFVFIIIGPLFVQAFYIPSEAMRDTLEVNDRILVNKLYYRLRSPQRGDVVVFWAPLEAFDVPDEKKEFIMRIIGTPGDVVEVKDRKLYINGKEIPEPYVHQPCDYAMKIVDGKVYWRNWYAGDTWSENNTPLDPERNDYVRRAPPGKIPEGKYLMLGDNRPNSNDGHKWGLLDRERILGKAMCIFWSVPLRNEQAKHPWRIGVIR